MMESTLPTLVLTALLVVQSALSCTCPPEEINKSKLDVLWDSYNNMESENIFTGKVLEANCKCFTSETELKCVNLSTGADGNSTQNTANERKQYNCEHAGRKFYRVLYYLGEYTCNRVFQMAFGEDQPYTTESSDVEISTNCEFRGLGKDSAHEECSMSLQPCTYKILVEDVFKGNLLPGDVIFSNGPDVLSRCNTKSRVLRIGQSYVVGIGSRCNANRNNWSEESTYEKPEIELLRILRQLKKDDN